MVRGPLRVNSAVPTGVTRMRITKRLIGFGVEVEREMLVERGQTPFSSTQSRIEWWKCSPWEVLSQWFSRAGGENGTT